MIPLKLCVNSIKYLEDYTSRILNIFPQEKINDINKTFKDDFKSIEGIDHFDFLKLATASFDEIKYWYDKIANDLDKFNEISLLEKSKQKPKLKKVYNDIVINYKKLMKKNNNGLKTNILIFKMFDVKVCPYCNANYVNSRGGHNSGGELDHFYDKISYPIFAVSLYNLVPCCSSCNRPKSSSKISISPHDSNFNFKDALKFSYVPKSLDFLYKDDELFIDMRFIEKDGISLEENLQKLKIYEAYEIHNAYVRDIIVNTLINSESQIDEYLESYPELFKNRNDVLRAIYGNYVNKDDFGERPLAKLTCDILCELGVGLDFT